MAPHTFLVSILIPVYNEAGNIDALLKRIQPIVKAYPHEILFVNDGSRDATLQDIQKHCAANPAVRCVSFTRNFGHQIALSAGYDFAQGDLVISIDADLQDPPEIIPQMIEKWQKGAQIVYAKRSKRVVDSFFKRTTAQWFYRIINMLSSTPIPMDVGDYRLLDRVVVDYLRSLPEHAKFLRGLVAWGGYRTDYVLFEREVRYSGTTHYPFAKMMSFALSGIVAFSIKPLQVSLYVGMVSACLGFFGMIYAIGRRLFLPHEYWVTGWTLLFVSLLFFSGVQLLMLGIIGEYIGRIFKQIQGRPLYLVGEKYNL